MTEELCSPFVSQPHSRTLRDSIVKNTKTCLMYFRTEMQSDIGKSSTSLLKGMSI